MFQLWEVLFLCGLLKGTSAALLPDLSSGLSNVVGQASPLLQNGLLGDAENTVDGVLQKLKVDVGALQDSSAFQQAQTKILGAGEHLLDNVLSKLQTQDGLLGVKISKSLILDPKLELGTDGIGGTLRFPITANVSVELPLIGQLINLGVSLDLLTGIKLETSAQNALPTVAVGECAIDPASISLSLLDRDIGLLNTVVDSVASTLSRVVSFLIQNQLSLEGRRSRQSSKPRGPALEAFAMSMLCHYGF
ncbi:PREDICTED: BPI fold-containing family A member 2 [Chinchilla lanigera]|uniref:BPI fold-containing family A member 2 n=1 Tax=Chinchilla lanigera TaxID=34839 RepID=UPI000698130B|nr:PREDICTED: BPI fold-containing family A member 2 [Chinchilla lanigera]